MDANLSWRVYNDLMWVNVTTCNLTICVDLCESGFEKGMRSEPNRFVSLAAVDHCVFEDFFNCVRRWLTEPGK